MTDDEIRLKMIEKEIKSFTREEFSRIFGDYSEIRDSLVEMVKDGLTIEILYQEFTLEDFQNGTAFDKFIGG